MKEEAVINAIFSKGDGAKNQKVKDPHSYIDLNGKQPAKTK